MIHPADDPRYINTREIAQVMGVTRQVAANAISQGTYPVTIMIATTDIYYYDRREFERWVADGAPDKRGKLRFPPTT